MLANGYSCIGRGRSGSDVKESQWLRGYFSAQGVGLCWIQKDSASASPGNHPNQTHEVCSAGCNPASERMSMGLWHWTVVSCYPSNWPVAAPYELELLRLWLPLWPLCDPASVVCHPVCLNNYLSVTCNCTWMTRVGHSQEMLFLYRQDSSFGLMSGARCRLSRPKPITTSTQ